MNVITIDQVRPGMIGFSCGYHWIQKAIAFFTRTKPDDIVPSHSFPIHLGPGGLLCVIETTIDQVHCVPLSRKMDEPDWIEVWEPICDDAEIQAAARASFLAYPDQQYGYLSHLWFIWRWLMRRIGREPRSVWKWASGGITCTELTCGDLEARGAAWKTALWGRDYNAMDPFTLRAIFQARPDLVRLVGWLKLPR